MPTEAVNDQAAINASIEAAVEKTLDFAEALGPHDFALGILLGAFSRLACANPCCTQQCSNLAFQASMHLARVAAEARPPAGLPLH